MTIENTEDTTLVGASEPAEPPALEPPAGADFAHGSAPRADVANPVIEIGQATAAHDSTPPMSRKLAPPPKPKRESGAASAPPSRPPGEGPDLLASASALKAPIAPMISFSASGELTLDSHGLAEPGAPAATAPVAPLSQPPPMRRRSNPSIPDTGEASSASAARMPSEPALSAGDTG